MVKHVGVLPYFKVSRGRNVVHLRSGYPCTSPYTEAISSIVTICLPLISQEDPIKLTSMGVWNAVLSKLAVVSCLNHVCF